MTDTRDRPCTLPAKEPEALDDGVLRLIDRVRPLGPVVVEGPGAGFPDAV